jgi:serine/threonine protein kinase
MSERELFMAALQIEDLQTRAVYLSEACGHDGELRQRVEGLLKALVAAGSFIQEPAAYVTGTADQSEIEWPTTSVPVETSGSVIGPYKLLEEIGEGGFGVVFMAEQQEPIRRKVALKVLKPGMDTRQVVARFEAERQALALMDHANIAKVLDAGQATSGRPYFVMDLVKGISITEYCDQNQLTPRERLELFVHVCQAVQHAHQKGIIHRDLKPSNVLVTLQDCAPLVKVIDFGIAKAIGQQLTDKTMFTGFAQMIGSPLYMSPEQAALSNVDVDTRSDLYSLGVLLYELLTGTTPFEKERFSQVGYDEMRRIIREEEPPRPSARITTLGQAAITVSERRQSDPRRLSQLFRGELDWIVMKALEKDRNRRYESASAFTADVQHYLNDEPVQACPPSASYRFRKFARRNRLMLAISGSATLVLVLIVAGLATGIVLLGRANTRIEEQRDVAQQKQQLARDAVDEMYSDVAEEWLRSRVGMRTVQKRFLQKALRYYEEFAKEDSTDPGVRKKTALAHFKIGMMESTLGNDRHARESFAQAFALLDRLAADFPDKHEYQLELARVCTPAPGYLPDPETTLNRGLNLAHELVDEVPDVPEYLKLLEQGYSCLAYRQGMQGRFAEVEATARQYLHWTEKLAALTPGEPKHQLSLANAHNDLGEAFNHTGRFSEAEKEYRQAIALVEQTVSHVGYQGAGAPLATYNGNLGEVLINTGRPEQAERPYLLAVAVYQRFAEEFPDTPNFRDNVALYLSRCADLYQRLGRWQDAFDASHKARAVLSKLVNDFPSSIYFLGRLIEAHCKTGILLEAKGRQEEGIAEVDKVIPQLTKAIELNPDQVQLRYWYALIIAEAGDLTGYRRACVAILDRFRRTESPTVAHWVAWSLVLAPDAVMHLNHPVRLAEMAVKSDPKNDQYCITLGSALYRAGRFDEAIRCLNEISTDREPATGKLFSPIYAWFFLAMAHHRLGHVEEARKWLDKASKSLEQEVKAPSDEANRSWNRRLTWQLLRREAEALLKQSEADHDKPKEKEKPHAERPKPEAAGFVAA